MIRSCLFVLIACLTVACEVVSTKTVSLPKVPERLAVNGLFTNLGIGVYVTKTVPVLQSNLSTVPLDVNVIVKKNENPFLVLQKKADIYTSDSVWNYSKDYTLEVQHATLGKAFAILEPIPLSVPIKETLIAYNQQQSEAMITISFQDLRGDDYYAYKVIAANNGTDFIDESIYKVPTGNLFNDIAFESKTKAITVRQFLLKEIDNNKFIKANRIKVYLYHLSKSTHDYYRSLREYESFNDDAFAEVNPVKNNIINGYGFVGICSIDSLTVNLK